MSSVSAQEEIERGRITFEFNIYARRGIGNPAIQMSTRRDLIDKGSKADALYDACHMDFAEHRNTANLPTSANTEDNMKTSDFGQKTVVRK